MALAVGDTNTRVRRAALVLGESKAMANQSLLREFLLFIKHEKKWWLVPLIAVLLGVGALVYFASSSSLAPFIYPLF